MRRTPSAQSSVKRCNKNIPKKGSTGESKSSPVLPRPIHTYPRVGRRVGLPQNRKIHPTKKLQKAEKTRKIHSNLPGFGIGGHYRCRLRFAPVLPNCEPKRRRLRRLRPPLGRANSGSQVEAKKTPVWRSFPRKREAKRDRGFLSWQREKDPNYPGG